MLCFGVITLHCTGSHVCGMAPLLSRIILMFLVAPHDFQVRGHVELLIFYVHTTLHFVCGMALANGTSSTVPYY